MEAAEAVAVVVVVVAVEAVVGAAEVAAVEVAGVVVVAIKVTDGSKTKNVRSFKQEISFLSLLMLKEFFLFLFTFSRRVE